MPPLTSSPPLLPRLYLSVLCNKIIKEDSALHCGRQRSPQTLETRITIVPTTRLSICTFLSRREARDFTQEADLICGVCGAHGGYESAKVRDVRRTGEGRGLRGGQEKKVGGVFPGRPQSFRHQRRPVVDDYSPGRGGNDAGRRNQGRNVSGENDRCVERLGWTMACSTMSMYGHHIHIASKGNKDQPGKLDCQSCSWAAEQEIFFFPCPRSRLRIWSRKTGSAVRSRVSLLVYLHT